MSGFSLPATEHSCMTSYSKENEYESFKRIIEVTPENTTVSVVSDTWDIYNACEMWNRLASLIEEKNITLVVRPDSGSVKEVLPKVITILNKAFKGKYNSKGYKVFNNLKILWGDGINEDTVTEVFYIAMGLGVSADSILTGSGGGLMQNNIDRDTSKYAFKASNAIINGISTPIGKDPITDAGKVSKKGYLDIVYDKDGNYKTIVVDNPFGNVKSLLKLRYCNGGTDYMITTDLEQVREKLNKYL
jgi:nicotinamide phosphoribosyltransferase